MAPIPPWELIEQRVGRCESEHGMYRCQAHAGHGGAHVADTGNGRALRWGMVGVGCHEPECIRKPNHALPHRNGRGLSWWPWFDEPGFD